MFAETNLHALPHCKELVDELLHVLCRLPILCVPTRFGGMYATLAGLYLKMRWSVRCSASVHHPTRLPLKIGATPFQADYLG